MAPQGAPQGLTDDQYREIGRVAVASALVEHAVQYCLWPLVGQDQPAARLVLAGRAFSELTGLLIKLAGLRLKGETAENAIDLAGRARKAYDERNALLHNRLMPIWGGQPEIVARLRFPRRDAKRPDVTMDQVPLKEIRKLSDKLEQVGRELTELGGQLMSRHEGHGR